MISQIKLIYFSSHFHNKDVVGQEYGRRKGKGGEIEYVECETEEKSEFKYPEFPCEPQESLLGILLWPPLFL